MILRPILLLAATCLLLPLSHSAPVHLQKRDADFYGVRTRIKQSTSGILGDPPGKYFHESVFHSHYDGRFAAYELPEEQRRAHLKNLVRTYLSTMRDIGAQTWIMHGTLLGWWWNRKILPWDSDIDVQVSESSMRYLADYYNMTVHHYKLPGIEGGKDYLLEINPHYVDGSTSDWLNVIDARWIDMDTGLFIDITTLRRDEAAAARGLHGRMMCKDRHNYLEKDIFPLRESTYEDMPVLIPYGYTELLEEEYGAKSLTTKDFEFHHFDETIMEWVPIWSPRQPAKPKPRPNVHPNAPVPGKKFNVLLN